MRSVLERLIDVRDHIAKAQYMLSDKSIQDLETDYTVKFAYERCLEIISEASRFVLQDMKVRYGPDIPWRQIADIGNVLRHAYDRMSIKGLWAIYTDDLEPLQKAIDTMIAEVL